MGTIMKIAYNCKKATFLIEKQQISRITLIERIELKIHLAGCSVCRTFQKQSMLINQMVSKHFADHHHLVLDSNFKDRLQQKINEKLNKN